MTAPQAAGVIHTDFEKGFIRAQTISYQNLIDSGSIANAKTKGLLRSEGKEYVVNEGDVMEFLFNVQKKMKKINSELPVFYETAHAELASALEMLAACKKTDSPRQALGYFMHLSLIHI